MQISKGSIKRIVVFGPQGSGKGTQAEMISQDLNLPWIATGNIYRQHIQEQTELGKIAEQYIKEGKLVPDDITNKLVAERLKEHDAHKGFIFDGYPRNIDQAKIFSDMVKIDAVLEIAISDEEAISRISGRRVCPCGVSYHIMNNPPKKEGLCDKCGESLIHREDDTEPVIKERLAIYHHDTEPVLDMYLKQRILIRINGEQSIADVHKEIFLKLNNEGFAKK
ncbi:adenylate kinase [Patescibacteria group bacterium]|nr:adenylate kinase [Patescibacteria group bacterium]